MFAGPLKFLLKGILGALWLLCILIVAAGFGYVIAQVLPYTPGITSVPFLGSFLVYFGEFGQGFGGQVAVYVRFLVQGFISNLIDSSLAWDESGIFSSVAYLVLGALITGLAYILIKFGIEAVTGKVSYSSLFSGFGLDTIESLLGGAVVLVVLIGGLNGSLGSTDLFIGLFILGFGIYLNHLKKTTFAKNVLVYNLLVGVIFSVFVLALAPAAFNSMVFGLLPDGNLTTMAANSVAEVSSLLPKAGLRYIAYILAFSWVFIFLMNPSHQGKKS